MNDRQNRILAILKEKQFLTISEIAKSINYSESTVRRDLNKLETQEIVKRTHGGALLLKPHQIEMPTEYKQNIHWRQKDYLARLATGYIEDNQFIFLDGSSTSNTLAHYLNKTDNLRIVTTNMSTATYLSIHTRNEIYAIGGLMNDTFTSSTMALENLNRFNYDLAFISCRGISPKYGITDRVESEAEIKQTVVRRSEHSILLADDSKFSQAFPYVDCEVGQLSAVVTNKEPNTEYMKMFKDNGVEVVY